MSASLISVIVPVYNVELYLEKCLDSIIGQTYKDLEILVIDDGSTDCSGSICDVYAEKDKRVKVFHTTNQGLSAARNIGLDNAKGEYIGFVDSDDWIESKMYETLLKKAEETNADIVECAYCREYFNKSIKQNVSQKEIYSEKTIEALLNGQISSQVWNKLYRCFCFKSVRFPYGHSFEDIATTHKIINHKSVTCISIPFYHWIQRESGLSRSHDIKNLIDYWLANKTRYLDLYEDVNEEGKKSLLTNLAYAIARSWVWSWKSNQVPEFYKEISKFARDNYPFFGKKNWYLRLRVCIFLARYNCSLSYVIAYIMNRCYNFLKPKNFK